MAWRPIMKSSAMASPCVVACRRVGTRRRACRRQPAPACVKLSSLLPLERSLRLCHGVKIDWLSSCVMAWRWRGDISLDGVYRTSSVEGIEISNNRLGVCISCIRKNLIDGGDRRVEEIGLGSASGDNDNGPEAIIRRALRGDNGNSRKRRQATVCRQ